MYKIFNRVFKTSPSVGKDLEIFTMFIYNLDKIFEKYKENYRYGKSNY